MDLVIKDVEKIKNFEDKKQKNRISIRASKNNLKNNVFFVLQIAYNINSNIYSDFNNNQQAYDMLNLFLDYYNGVMVCSNKNYRHIKTIVIPLVSGNEKQNKTKI